MIENVAIYARVSTKQQENDMQLTPLREFVARMGSGIERESGACDSRCGQEAATRNSPPVFIGDLRRVRSETLEHRP